eukprot:PLAT12492.32.p1 GENE.PLAT12492.32~~PLAT12492.32.p1  ORF type:complete len:3532 (+),score=1996.96 PLAT12492.32:1397-10597(+)
MHDATLPRIVADLRGDTAVAAATTLERSAVVLSSGALYTFGRNSIANELGLTSDGGYMGDHTPKRVGAFGSEPGCARAVDVVMGSKHTLVITSEGGVMSFGSSSSGQCGQGSTDDVTRPMLITAGLGGLRATAVAAGNEHSVVLTEDGGVWTFGASDYGQLGLGDAASRVTPCRIEGLSSRIVQVAAAGNATFLLTAEGSLLYCGSMEGLAPSPVPKQVQLPGGRALRAVAIGGSRLYMLSAAKALDSLDGVAVLHSRRALSILVPRGDAVICRTFSSRTGAHLGDQQGALFQPDCAMAADVMNGLLWAYSPSAHRFGRYQQLRDAPGTARYLSGLDMLFEPRFALPLAPGALVKPVQVGLALLGVMDALSARSAVTGDAASPSASASASASAAAASGGAGGKRGLEAFMEPQEFLRHSSHQKGWGYGGSVDCICFQVDSPVEICAVLLFGGDGEFSGELKISEGKNETGTVVASTRYSYPSPPDHTGTPVFLDEPFVAEPDQWYHVLTRVSGRSGWYGEGAPMTITTELGVVFNFCNSQAGGQNGTTAARGQIAGFQIRPPLLLSSLSSGAAAGAADVDDGPTLRLDIDVPRLCTDLDHDGFQSLMQLLQWARAVLSGERPGDSELAAFTTMVCLRLQSQSLRNPAHRERLQLDASSYASFLWAIDSELRELIRLVSSRDEHSQLAAAASDIFQELFDILYPTWHLKMLCMRRLLAEVRLESSPAAENLLAAVLNFLSKRRGVASLCFKHAAPLAELGIDAIDDLLTDEAASGRADSASKRASDGADSGEAGGSTEHDAAVAALASLHEQEEKEPDGDDGAEGALLQEFLQLVSAPSERALAALSSAGAAGSSESSSAYGASVASLLATVQSEVLDSLPLGGSSTTTVLGDEQTLNRFTGYDGIGWGYARNPDCIGIKVSQPIEMIGLGLWGGSGEYQVRAKIVTGLDTGGGETICSCSTSYNRRSPEPGQVYFDEPALLEPGQQYTIVAHISGGSSHSGHGGKGRIVGDDGTEFEFLAARGRNNGTSVQGGQIPQLLYRTPAVTVSTATTDDSGSVESAPLFKSFAAYARQVFGLSSRFLMQLRDVELAAGDADGEGALQALLAAHPVLQRLLPMLLGRLSVMAARHVQFARDLFPDVCQLLRAVDALNARWDRAGDGSAATPPPFYTTTLESGHPYRASLTDKWDVQFPADVNWMVVEFDPRCSTVQATDVVRLYTDTACRKRAAAQFGGNPEDAKHSRWPTGPLILPGRQLSVTLTAGAEPDKVEGQGSGFGLGLTVTGYSMAAGSSPLHHMELELAHVAGVCFTCFMSPPSGKDEAALRRVLSSDLFRGGVDAREMNGDDMEQLAFLKEFADMTPDSAGASLALYLNPRAVRVKTAEEIAAEEAAARAAEEEAAARRAAEEAAAKEAADKAAAAAPPPADWSCPACTFRNKAKDGICGVCGSARPGLPAPEAAKPDDGSWECPVCTLRNAADAAKCAVCNNDRPAPAGGGADASDPLPFGAGLDDSWACSVCTVRNKAAATVCATCGTARGKKVIDGWKCSNCTLVNMPASARCEACGADKEDAGKAVPPPVESPEVQAALRWCFAAALWHLDIVGDAMEAGYGLADAEEMSWGSIKPAGLDHMQLLWAEAEERLMRWVAHTDVADGDDSDGAAKLSWESRKAVKWPINSDGLSTKESQSRRKGVSVIVGQVQPAGKPFYFEVQLVQAARGDALCVGVVTTGSESTRRHLGETVGTFGYSGETGNVMRDGKRSFASPFTAGHVVGCGYDARRGALYWTLDGSLVHTMAAVAPTVLRPAVTAAPGAIVMANFGDTPFRYAPAEVDRVVGDGLASKRLSALPLECQLRTRAQFLLQLTRVASVAPPPLRRAFSEEEKKDDGGAAAGGDAAPAASPRKAPFMRSASSKALDAPLMPSVLMDDMFAADEPPPPAAPADAAPAAAAAAPAAAAGAAGGAKSAQGPFDEVIVFLTSSSDPEIIRDMVAEAGKKVAVLVDAYGRVTSLVSSLQMQEAAHELLWFVAAGLHVGAEAVTDADGMDITSIARHFLDSLSGCAASDRAAVRTAFYELLTELGKLLSDAAAGPFKQSLQSLVLRCWSMEFQEDDHGFLNESGIFSHLRTLMVSAERPLPGVSESKSDGDSGDGGAAAAAAPASTVLLSHAEELTAAGELSASSGAEELRGLHDHNVDTYWESSYDDTDKWKWVRAVMPEGMLLGELHLYVDNKRDGSAGPQQIVLSAGASPGTLTEVDHIHLPASKVGWLSLTLPPSRVLQLNLKSGGRTTRVRALQLHGPPSWQAAGQAEARLETEALRLFKVLASEVFGDLMGGAAVAGGLSSDGLLDGAGGGAGGDAAPPAGPPGLRRQGSSEKMALREHLAGVLFDQDRRHLSGLQRHLFDLVSTELKAEAARFKNDRVWEMIGVEESSADEYAFELVSICLSLSGSVVGKRFLAGSGIMDTLLTLLPLGTPRMQRTLLSILRRILLDLAPSEVDVTAVAGVDADVPPVVSYLCLVFAKSLRLQVRGRVAGRPMMADAPLGDGWVAGAVSLPVAKDLLALLRELREQDSWRAEFDKVARATVLSLPVSLEVHIPTPLQCVQLPALWLALASLSIVGEDHSSLAAEEIRESSADDGTVVKEEVKFCDNHMDGKTRADWQCADCSKALCGDCDHYLHLPVGMREHSRTPILSTEREPPKLDYHEGCARLKLSWLMVLVDVTGCKAVVEFRKDSTRSAAAGEASCRFCDATLTAENRYHGDVPSEALENVCNEPDCVEKIPLACTKRHLCGCVCGGIRDEESCLPCFKCPAGAEARGGQDADDYCMICWTESLGAAPTILLECGHAFHHSCAQALLRAGYPGPRITFEFRGCPLCKTTMSHPGLTDLLDPITSLRDKVAAKAVMRAKYEELDKAPEVRDPGSRFFGDLEAYAMDRFAYYMCHECKEPYYGGERACGEAGGEFDPTELICGGCSPFAAEQHCDKHGTEFLEFKCRFCCNVAIFFCFGTTHFCGKCHDQPGRMTGKAKHELPHCPAGPLEEQLEGECPLGIDHPPTGEEFALGCGICRNAKTTF